MASGLDMQMMARVCVCGWIFKKNQFESPTRAASLFKCTSENPSVQALGLWLSLP